jgi:hypothetical protein
VGGGTVLGPASAVVDDLDLGLAGVGPAERHPDASAVRVPQRVRDRLAHHPVDRGGLGAAGIELRGQPPVDGQLDVQPRRPDPIHEVAHLDERIGTGRRRVRAEGGIEDDGERVELGERLLPGFAGIPDRQGGGSGIPVPLGQGRAGLQHHHGHGVTGHVVQLACDPQPLRTYRGLHGFVGRCAQPVRSRQRRALHAIALGPQVAAQGAQADRHQGDRLVAGRIAVHVGDRRDREGRQRREAGSGAGAGGRPSQQRPEQAQPDAGGEGNAQQQCGHPAGRGQQTCPDRVPAA